MSAVRLNKNGDVLYRDQTIRLNRAVQPSKLGRYSYNGKPFAQLGHAKAAIDEILK